MDRILYYNARIHTQDPLRPLASAMLVGGGRILAVGELTDIHVPVPCTRRDLRGKTVLPGFNDAHIHLWKVGQLKSYIIDLRNVRSIAELQSRVKQVAEKLPPGTWITGRGFNEAVLDEKRMPFLSDLDAITTHHPVYLIRTCAHIAVVNGMALTLSGVTEATAAPEGGVIGKDEFGCLTGAFYETALGLITKHIPPPTQEDYLGMIRAGVEAMLANGITSITDPAAHPELLEAYQKYASDNPAIRLNIMPILLPDGGQKPFPVPPLHQSEFLTVDTVKFFSDGGLSGKTAALSRPYKNSTDQGVLRLEASRFLALARDAQQKGFRVATHAIGDRAIDLVLEVYTKLHAEFGDRRSRIEHFGLPTPEHVMAMEAYTFVAVTQPIFLEELGENFIGALDDEYLASCYPIASLLKRTIPVAFSTDAPVVANLNPWNNIQCSLERKSRSGKTIAVEESVTLEQALRAYTAGSAFAEGKEHLKGALAPGQYADFIVVDRDPFGIPVQELRTLRVEETFVNGICRWPGKKIEGH